MENSTPPPIPPTPPPPHVSAARPAAMPRRGGTAWRAIALVLLCLLLVSLFSNLKHLFNSGGRHSGVPTRAGIPRLEETVIEENDTTNKIAVVEVDGIITAQLERGGATMVELIQDQFKVAARAARGKAGILQGNSPGGGVL